MDKNLASGKLGTVGTYSVDFTDGKLVAVAGASDDGIDVGMHIGISGKAVIDGIVKKIGGPIPAEIAQFLELSLGLK